MKGYKSKVVSETDLILLIHLNLDELRKIVKGVKNNKKALYHEIFIDKGTKKLSMCIP